MINISRRCMDFLRSLTRGTDDLLNNPAVNPEDAALATANALIKATQYQGVRKSIGTFIRNNYLFNLATVLTNFIGNMGRALEIPAARLAAGKPREAMDIVVGYTKAFNKVFPRFIGGFRNIDIELDTIHMQKFDVARGILKMDPNKAIDKYINKPINAFVTFPQNLQRGVDEGFVSLFEHAELEVLVNRLARKSKDDKFTRNFLSEKGIAPERFINDIETAIKNADPTDPMWKTLKDIAPDVATEIEEFSRYATFRSKLGSSTIDQATKGMVKVVDAIPELAAVLPFIVTPVNIAKFGAGYVPLLGFARYRQATIDIAELVTKRASLSDRLATAKSPNAVKNIQKRIDKLDGEIQYKRDLNRDILGQQILGVGLIGTAYSMVANSQLTGAYPTDPARRNAMQNAGIPEFSVKIGDKWVSYAGVEPLHTILAMTANSFDAIKQAEREGKDWKQLGFDIGNVIKASFLDKTFTKQLSDMLLAVQEPERKGEALAVSLSNGLLPSFLYQIARAQDPIKRDVKDPELATWIMNNLRQRIPGMREDLPARYNLLGEEATVGSPGSIISGRKIEPATQTEIQKVLSNPNMKLREPSRSLYGVELTGEQYSQMSKLMGDITNQALSLMITNPGFQAMPEFTKAFMVSGLISEVRSNVRLHMIPIVFQNENQRREAVINELRKRGINPVESNIEID